MHLNISLFPMQNPLLKLFNFWIQVYNSSLKTEIPESCVIVNYAEEKHLYFPRENVKHNDVTGEMYASYK